MWNRFREDEDLFTNRTRNVEGLGTVWTFELTADLELVGTDELGNERNFGRINIEDADPLTLMTQCWLAGVTLEE